MHNLNWDDLRYLLAVVSHESLNAAANSLRVNHTTVSRRISALEKRLGKPLFERSSRGWITTPAADAVVQHAEQMAELANGIQRHIAADSHELRGVLRVTAADHCVEQLLLPTMHRFVQRYPQIELELIATADEVDLAAREADIALRATDEPPPNVVGTRICRIGFALYGAHSLLNQISPSHTLQQLPCITWVGDGQTRPEWIDQYFPETTHIHRTTNAVATMAMARQGIGIANMACILGDADDGLSRIVDVPVTKGPYLWVLSHVDLRTTARVRIFRDFLVDDLNAQKHKIERGASPGSA